MTRSKKPSASVEEIEALLSAKEAGRFTRGWAAWALDMLIFGKHKEAEVFLRRALSGEPYPGEKPDKDLDDMLM